MVAGSVSMPVRLSICSCTQESWVVTAMPATTPTAVPSRPISVPSIAKIALDRASLAPIVFRIAMSLDFSMIIMIRVTTIAKAATTMIIVSSTNIITRSVFSAWKKAGKKSFQSRVK